MSETDEDDCPTCGGMSECCGYDPAPVVMPSSREIAERLLDEHDGDVSRWNCRQGTALADVLAQALDDAEARGRRAGLEDGTTRDFVDRGAPGGSYCARVIFQDAFVTVEDAYGRRVSFPASDVAEVVEDAVRRW